MDKPVYIQKAPSKSNEAMRILMFFVLFITFCALLFVASMIPYSGIVTLFVIMAFAICSYKLMKNTVFDITYVLYADKLVFKRRYGLIEVEMETFYLDKAVFKENSIICEKEEYDFYPDEKLKGLLLK